MGARAHCLSDAAHCKPSGRARPEASRLARSADPRASLEPNRGSCRCPARGYSQGTAFPAGPCSICPTASKLLSKPAMRSSGRSGMAGWRWSTGPATSATTGSSRSRYCNPPSPRSSARDRFLQGDQGRGPAAASPSAAVVRLRRCRRLPLLCHALHGRRLAPRPPRPRGPPRAAAGASPRARSRGCPRLRAPPGRDPPRHQTREHPARGGPRHRGRLRRGPRGERGGRERPHAAPALCPARPRT